MKNSICIIIFILTSIIIAKDYTISGYIRDANTGEELLEAVVYINEIDEGSFSNNYGFYSITVPEGKYTCMFSYPGYHDTSVQIMLNKDIELNVDLLSTKYLLSKIVVQNVETDKTVSSTEMGSFKLNVEDLDLIPVLFGEKDILKTIQLMPGVSPSSEASSGYFVRGGNIDQNLILLDEAPVYNAGHLAGFFSVFNSDALKDIKFYKAGIPAEYGGRLSSVLNISMYNGNKKEYHVSGGIGLISSRLTVEGPTYNNLGSFLISGRRTYADILARALIDDVEEGFLYFYDLNMKLNHWITKSDRIFLSGYFGRDKLGADVFGFNWGNRTGTLRWNHIFTKKIFSNTSFIYSNYNYKLSFRDESDSSNIIDFGVKSGIEDFNFKEDMSLYLNTDNTIKLGLNCIYHTFSPANVSIATADTTIVIAVIPEQYSVESGFYISNEQKLTDKISLNYGLRTSLYHSLGPGNVNTYDENKNVVSTKSYDDKELIKWYYEFEPRITGTYLIKKDLSVKASYCRMSQYNHLLSSSTINNPTDFWIPSNTYIKPQLSDMISVGTYFNLFENMFDVSFEIYYKNLKNQIDFKNGADIFGTEHLETQLVFGKGWAYGTEILLKKQKGDITGWFGYTLSLSERKFPDIYNGAVFPARQSRTHDLSVTLSYKFAENWTASTSWVYYTGDAVTFPSGRYMFEDEIVPLFTERNGYRMPGYHRLDIGFTYKSKIFTHYDSIWNFSVYNVYLRENPYIILFREKEDNPGVTEAVQYSVFKIVPAVTWNFKF